MLINEIWLHPRIGSGYWCRIRKFRLLHSNMYWQLAIQGEIVAYVYKNSTFSVTFVSTLHLIFHIYWNTLYIYMNVYCLYWEEIWRKRRIICQTHMLIRRQININISVFLFNHASDACCQRKYYVISWEISDDINLNVEINVNNVKFV